MADNLHPYPIRELATWWNNLDLGAPPARMGVLAIDEIGPASAPADSDIDHDEALLLVTTSRLLDLELEATSTALAATSLGVNLMELTATRYQLDGSIDYDAWINSLADVRDQMWALAQSVPSAEESDSDELAPLPEPFNQIEQLLIKRSQAGLPTLLNGPTAATACLLTFARHALTPDHVRFLCYSPSPLTVRVIEQLRVPVIVPYEVAFVDSELMQLALDAIAAAVNNAENSRLALLADLNPQTEA